MWSRSFFMMFPLMAVLAIMAFSAGAAEEEKHTDAVISVTGAELRDAVEKDNAEDFASPDIPNPESEPDRPQQSGKSNDSAHEHMEAYVRPTLKVTASPAALEKGKEVKITLMLREPGGQPVTLDKLVERHTKKVHLLIVDESLADYHHLHPEEGDKPGAYTFSFTPHLGYSYILYADVKPEGGQPQMVPTLLQGAEKCDNCVDKAAIDRADFSGHKAYISFGKKRLKVGAPARGSLFISTADNTPVKNLEPVMGAYGHIVGFHEGFGAVAHIHPLGAEPESDDDRGASPLNFMLHPENPGFVKLFAQVRLDGKEVFLPFSVFVDP